MEPDPEYEPLLDEDQAIGRESHLIQQVPPGPNPNAEGDYPRCNAKRTEDVKDSDTHNEYDETRTVFQGYCRNKAGKGTDHVGEGRCKHHGGKAGAPKHNQNGATHAATADPHHYAESLPTEEREFVEDATATICDRIRAQKGDVDFLDRILARRVAIKLHMVAKASDYVENVSGLLQTIQHEHGSHEDKAPLIDEIRRYDDSIFGNLRQLGVLNDPESQKADAMGDWREFITSGQQRQSPNQK